MKRNLSVILLLFPLLCGCLAAGDARPVPVAGKVTLERLAAAGVEVMAWPEGAEHLEGPAPFVAEATAADGRFRLELPRGSYYLLARGEGVFAYYGRNPLAIGADGSLDLTIGLVRLPEPETLPADGVSGTVTLHGVPQPGAVVFVYTDLNSQFKGMGYLMSAPTGDDGRFALDLDDGTYYLLARLRQGRSGVGPLRAGDLIGYAPGNPVRVRGGQSPPVAIPLLEVPEKVDRLQASLFGATRISGTIRDASGVPVAGVRAVVYDRSQMLDRPLYVSQPTGSDGRYVVSLPEGGTYYLAARDTLGGAPAPGDLYGTYDADPEHRLQLETGTALEAIDMVVEAMW